MGNVSLGGARSRPRERPTPGLLGAAFTTLGALLFRGVAADHQDDERDRRLAERGHRLHQLMSGEAPVDIYQDLVAILTERFDHVLEQVMDGELPPACLNVLRDFAAEIDKEWVLGAHAMQRLADKRLVSAQAIAHQKRAEGTTEASWAAPA